MTTPTPTPDPAPPLTPVVAPEQIAKRLGVKNPDQDLLDMCQEAIDDAIAEVEGYLGRPITPAQQTAYHLMPWPWGWDLRSDQQVRAIISVTPETAPDGTATGMFTVVYQVGIDYLNDVECRPIRRYVVAAAGNNYDLLMYAQRELKLRGPVSSVSTSTEGQSKNVQYAHLGYMPPTSRSASQGMDYPGQLPKLTTLDRWRLAGRRVHQAPDRGYDYREWSPDGYPRWWGYPGGGGQGSDANGLPPGYSGGVPGSSTPGDWGFPTDGYQW